MWWYDSSDDSLHFGSAAGKEAQRWIPTTRKARGVNRKYETVSINSRIPYQSTPAICIHQGKHIYYTGTYNVLDSTAVHIKTSDTMFTRYLRSLPTALQWAIEHSSGWHNLPALLEAFQTGNLIGVTDGSYKSERGTAHWIICDQRNPNIRMRGDVHTPGEANHQQSTRAELSGLYGLATMAKVMSQLQPSGTFRVGCDSQKTSKGLSSTSNHTRL